MKHRYPPWSESEMAVLDRYVRSVAADRSLSAFEAARGLTRELVGLAPWRGHRRSFSSVYCRLCEHLRRAGRDRDAGRDRWTRQETALKERYARAVVTGQYRSAMQAAPLLLAELNALPPGRARFVERSLVGVYARLQVRVQEMGHSPAKRPWLAAEQAVVERFVRKVIAGRYPTLRSAAPDCRRELRRHRHRIGPDRRVPAQERTMQSVWLRLQLVAREVCPDRVMVTRRQWTALECAIVDRYARKVARGFYRTPRAAAADCLREVARVTPPDRVRRTANTVCARLTERIRLLKLPPSGLVWTAAEERLLDRYARAMADGRLNNALEAATLCAAAINRLRRCQPDRYRASYVRTPHAVHYKLLPRIIALRYPWTHTKWTRPELEVADRFARAVIDHQYHGRLEAARACSDELEKLYAPWPGRRHAAGRPARLRSLASVHTKLSQRALELDWRQLPFRPWEPDERRVLARYVRSYNSHKNGRAAAGVMTLGRMMKAELGRLGWYRSYNACVSGLIAGRQHSLLDSVPASSGASGVRRRPKTPDRP